MSPNGTANTSASVTNPTGADPSGIDWNIALPRLMGYAENLFFAVLILLAGYLVSRWIGSAVAKALDKRDKLDGQVRILMVKGIRSLIMLITVVMVLGRFGIETASLIALLGGLGLAVGLALQGTLSNVASGVVIMVLRPFKLGQAIKANGEVYIIDDVGLFATRAHQPDGPLVTIPNNRLWGGEIVNLSQAHNDLRRIDQVMSISYSDDIDQAMRVAQEVLDADERFLKDPEPLIAVSNLGESSVDILVRTWVAAADWWPAKLALTKAIKQACDANDITIPFPQRDVHLSRDNAAAE